VGEVSSPTFTADTAAKTGFTECAGLSARTTVIKAPGELQLTPGRLRRRRGRRDRAALAPLAARWANVCLTTADTIIPTAAKVAPRSRATSMVNQRHVPSAGLAHKCPSEDILNRWNQL
jgi:hypothetical protein